MKVNKQILFFLFINNFFIIGVDDKEEMKLTQEAFDIMCFEEHETADLYKNCAGIMHMGEMKFKQRPREEQAEVDTDFGLYLIFFLIILLIFINFRCY